MAVILEGGCRVSDMREGDPVTEGTVRIWNQIGRATGAEAISLRVLEFAPGLSPGIRNKCDEVFYVLGFSWKRGRPVHNEVKERLGDNETRVRWERGRPVRPSEQTRDNETRIRWERGRPVRLSEQTRDDETVATICIDGHSHKVGIDTGIYLRPGEILAVENPGPDSLLLVSSQCPDPDRAAQFVTPLLTPSRDSTPPDRPPIVRLADRPAVPTADRWYRVLVDDEIGSRQVTQFVGSIPHGRAPDHFHNYEEVLFILRGRGRMWAGDTNAPIAPGSCIYLPKGQVHCVENTGADELRLLGVFYPAGSPSARYDVNGVPFNVRKHNSSLAASNHDRGSRI